MMTSPSDDLARFQNDGDISGLLQYAASIGIDVPEIQEVLAELDPIFTSLDYGLNPSFATLDRSALQSHAPGTEYVARAMVGSDRADLKSAGLQLVGLLDDPRLMDILLEALHSEIPWLRLTAIEAVGRMSAEYSRPVLQPMMGHEDVVTRRAVAEAMTGRSG